MVFSIYICLAMNVFVKTHYISYYISMYYYVLWGIIFIPSGEKPTLPKLLDLKVPAGVSDKYEEFGIILLKDEDGKKMAVIENDFRGKAEKITLQILKKWMEGDGMSVTWESLVIALRNCAPLFADQIEIALKKL